MNQLPQHLRVEVVAGKDNKTLSDRLFTTLTAKMDVLAINPSQ
jgi:hypothetical protein